MAVERPNRPDQATQKPPTGESLKTPDTSRGITGIAPITTPDAFLRGVNHRTGVAAAIDAHVAILGVLDVEDDRVLRRMPEGADPEVYRDTVVPKVEAAITRTTGEIRRFTREKKMTDQALVDGADQYPASVKKLDTLTNSFGEIGTVTFSGLDKIAKDGLAEVVSTRRRLEELPQVVTDFPEVTQSETMLSEHVPDRRLVDDLKERGPMNPKEIVAAANSAGEGYFQGSQPSDQIVVRRPDGSYEWKEPETSNSPMAVRVTPDERTLIDIAADVGGYKGRSDYMRTVALNAANAVIEEHGIDTIQQVLAGRAKASLQTRADEIARAREIAKDTVVGLAHETVAQVTQQDAVAPQGSDPVVSGERAVIEGDNPKVPYTDTEKTMLAALQKGEVTDRSVAAMMFEAMTQGGIDTAVVIPNWRDGQSTVDTLTRKLIENDEPHRIVPGEKYGSFKIVPHEVPVTTPDVPVVTVTAPVHAEAVDIVAKSEENGGKAENAEGDTGVTVRIQQHRLGWDIKHGEQALGRDVTGEKSRALLLYMAQHAGETVTKEQIAQFLETQGVKSSPNGAINNLKTQIFDNTREQPLISRVGYGANGGFRLNADRVVIVAPDGTERVMEKNTVDAPVPAEIVPPSAQPAEKIAPASVVFTEPARARVEQQGEQYTKADILAHLPLLQRRLVEEAEAHGGNPEAIGKALWKNLTREQRVAKVQDLVIKTQNSMEGLGGFGLQYDVDAHGVGRVEFGTVTELEAMRKSRGE